MKTAVVTAFAENEIGYLLEDLILRVVLIHPLLNGLSMTE